MKKVMHKLILITGIVFFVTVLLSSCSKSNSSSSSSQTAHDYFVNNLLGRDLAVTLAKNDTADITANFAGYTFHLTDTASFGGTISASNLVRSYVGTWSIDANYQNITFTYPAQISSLAFINKQWLISTMSTITISLTATSGTAATLQFKKL